MKGLLRKLIFGAIPVREYCTITIPNEINEKVCLESGGGPIAISINHWLLCLDPIVFGIWFNKETNITPFEKDRKYKIHFYDSANRSKTTSILTLAFFDKIENHEGTLLLLKLTQVRSYHINPIKTRLLFYKYYKKPEQDFKKLKSFAAAYSYPRKVRLISFKDKDYYNVFPMDLVGDIPGCKKYVFGLRHTNTTLARIIETKKIVVSEIPYEYKDIIYQLGKHHQVPVSVAVTNIEFIQTEVFNFPIPSWANSYKEIAILKTLNLGSHMLIWGEEINEKKISDSHGHLFHVHFLHYLHQKNKGSEYPFV